MSGCLSRISYAVASLARKGRTVILHKSSQIATACLRSPVNANAPMRCSHGHRIVDPAKTIQVSPSNNSCQVYCLAFEEELTVPLKYLSLFITP